MQITEIDARLHAALPLRVPMFDPDLAPRIKMDELEEYMRTCAYHRAELEEALHWIWEARKKILEQWTDVQGWEPMAGNKPTQVAIDNAKRVCAPDLWAGLQDSKHLMDSLERQIKRLTLDEAAMSRSFSMLTG